MANKTIVDLETDLVKPYIDNKVKDIYKVMGELGAKNLYPIDLASLKALNSSFSWNSNKATKNNIEFTINDDNTISCAGTASALTTFVLPNYGTTPNSVIISGCPEEGGASSCEIQVGLSNSDVARDRGAGATIVAGESTAFIHIIIRAGYTANNIVFKPMIRLASDTDPTYQPYVKTNQELTTQVTSLKEDLWNANSILGAKNLVELTANTITIGGTITITVDKENGTANVNGTSGSSGVSYALTDALELKEGVKYKVSGCPSGGASNTYYLAVYQSGVIDLSDKGSGVEFTATSAMTDVKLYLVVGANWTISNKLFKPMLTLATDVYSDYAHFVPYSKTNRQLTEDSVDWNDLSEVGAVNLGQNNLTTQTITTTGASLNLTVSDDKQITLNGEVSTSQYLTLDNDLSQLIGRPIKVYDIYGFNEKSYSYVSYVKDGTGYYKSAKNGVFIIPLGATNVKFMMVIYTGETFSNFKIAPMVVPASYNGDYVPYAKTNKELTDVVTNQIGTATLAGTDLTDCNNAASSGTLNIYMANLSTANSPYTAGVETSASSFVILSRVDTNTNWGMQLAIPMTTTKGIYMRFKASGTWGTWSKITP